MWKKGKIKYKKWVQEKTHVKSAQQDITDIPKKVCLSWNLSSITMCWRRLLRVLWTARRSNQSILKEISPEYSLEGLKLKLQYFGHLMWITDSMEKTLMLGKIEGRRRRGCQRMRWLDGISDSMDMSLGKVKDREAWHATLHGVSKSWTQLRDWTRITTSLNGGVEWSAHFTDD